MASTSSTSSSSSSASTISNGRYWGLASGLDVDSIVKGLLTDDQAKIDKANQKEQTLEWQQDAYRDIISKLNTFESSYLLFGSSTSMASSNMYNTYIADSGDSSILTATATADATGATQNVIIKQLATTATITGSQKVGKDITGTIAVNTNGLDNLKAQAATAEAANLADPSFNLNVDGTVATISFTSAELNSVGTTYSDMTALLNSKLSSAFGTVPNINADGTLAGGSSQKVTATTDGSGNLVITGASNYQSVISVSTSNSLYDGLVALGLKSGESNRLNTYAQTLGGLGLTTSGDGYVHTTINGTDIKLGTADTSVADAFSAINSSGAGVTISYNSITDLVNVTANQSGSAGKVDLTSTANQTQSFFTALKISTGTGPTYGNDAVVNINGNNYTRSTNNFTIDGVAYSLKATTDTAVSVSMETNTSSLKDGINKFISAYNDLIDAIYTQVGTKPDSSYPPLTDDKKENMTDTQIEKWEDKAKAGVLYNDGTLTSIADSMRNAFYDSVTTSDGKSVSIYDFGITTSDDTTNHGKLEIKPEDESKFEDALANKTSEIKDFFTKMSSTMFVLSPTQAQQSDQTTRYQTEGLADRLDDIIVRAAGSDGGSYGSLLTIAGAVDGTTQYKNTIYDELTDLNKQIATYKDQMTAKQERLYNEFTKLETYMEKANTQSSYLTSSLGGNS